MIVNQGSLREIYSSFNTVFNKTYEETTVLYPKIAMEVPSEASRLHAEHERVGGRQAHP